MPKSPVTPPGASHAARGQRSPQNPELSRAGSASRGGSIYSKKASSASRSLSPSRPPGKAHDRPKNYKLESPLLDAEDGDEGDNDNGECPKSVPLMSGHIQDLSGDASARSQSYDSGGKYPGAYFGSDDDSDTFCPPPPVWSMPRKNKKSSGSDDDSESAHEPASARHHSPAAPGRRTLSPIGRGRHIRDGDHGKRSQLESDLNAHMDEETEAAVPERSHRRKGSKSPIRGNSPVRARKDQMHPGGTLEPVSGTTLRSAKGRRASSPVHSPINRAVAFGSLCDRESKQQSNFEVDDEVVPKDSILHFNGRGEDLDSAKQSLIDSAQVLGLRDQLLTATKTIGLLSAKIQEMQNQIDLAASEQKQAEKRSNDLQKKYESAVSQIKKLQQEKSKLDEKAGGSEFQAKDANHKMELTQDKMARMMAMYDKQTDSWKTTVAERDHQIECLQEKRKELEEVIVVKDEEIANLLKALFRPAMKDQGTQVAVKTKEAGANTNPEAMKAEMDCQTDHVTIDGVTTEIKPATFDVGLMTNIVIETKKEDFTVYWEFIMTRANAERKLLHMKPGALMTKQQILTLINDIYTEKIIADELDDREMVPRQPLQKYVQTYFIQNYEDKQKADDALVKALANLLSHLLRDTHSQSEALKKSMEQYSGEENKPAVYKIEQPIHHRVAMFARFLYLLPDDSNYPPIPLAGLNVFLAMLVRSQKGCTPLLHPGMEKVYVPQIDVQKACEYVFARTKAITVGRLKTELADLNHDNREIDLEMALEHTVKMWSELDKKWDIRLEALFVSSDSDGDGNLDLSEFCNMVAKLKQDGTENISLRLQLRLYSRMCQFARVDSRVFVKCAMEHELAIFRVGPPIDNIDISKEQEDLFAKLQPLYTATSEAMEDRVLNHEKLAYKGVVTTWKLIEFMMYQRGEPEMCWLFYNTITKRYAQISRLVKNGILAGDPEPEEPEVAPRRRNRRSSVSYTTPNTPGSHTPAAGQSRAPSPPRSPGGEPIRRRSSLPHDERKKPENSHRKGSVTTPPSGAASPRVKFSGQEEEAKKVKK